MFDISANCPSLQFCFLFLTSMFYLQFKIFIWVFFFFGGGGLIREGNYVVQVFAIRGIDLPFDPI